MLFWIKKNGLLWGILFFIVIFKKKLKRFPDRPDGHHVLCNKTLSMLASVSKSDISRTASISGQGVP
jgi:hypothetical protein